MTCRCGPKPAEQRIVVFVSSSNWGDLGGASVRPLAAVPHKPVINSLLSLHWFTISYSGGYSLS